MTSSLNPQAQNFSACRRKFSVSSIHLSCVCRCWGVRNVPLVQITGCSCFIEFPATATIAILQPRSKGAGARTRHWKQNRGGCVGLPQVFHVEHSSGLVEVWRLAHSV